MKSVFIFLTIGVFFSLLSAFIVQNFSPFDSQKVEELIKSSNIQSDSADQLDSALRDLVSNGLILDYLSSNAYLSLFTIAAGLISFLTSIHLFLDKVFFKSLWDSPSIFNAVRRASLLVISLVIATYLRFLKVESLTIFLVPATAIFAEIIFMNIKTDIIRLININRHNTTPS